MIKVFTVPEHQVEYSINNINIDITNMQAVINLGQKVVGSNKSYAIEHVMLDLNTIVPAGLANQNITQADINGFMKCWNLLAAKAMGQELIDM